MLRSADEKRPIGWTRNPARPTALGSLLRGRAASIPVDDTTAAIRARFEQLRGDEILELKHGAYRAAEIALYQHLRAVTVADDPLTSKWDDLLTSAGNPR